jgi:hypothetical protein
MMMLTGNRLDGFRVMYAGAGIISVRTQAFALRSTAMHSVRVSAAMLTITATVLGSLQATAQDRAVLPFTGWGSLSGQITLEGPIPAVRTFENDMKAHGDKVCCLAGKPGEKIDPAWTVDPKSRGVAHAVVFLKVGSKQFFPIHEKDRERKQELVIDQPHCAFLPFVTTLYPSYFDGKKQVPTGQSLIIKNSSTVRHNVRAIGDPKINEGFNRVVEPGGSMPASFEPQRYPIPLNCDFHKWMSGYIWVFEHPYVAVTGSDGRYEIPRVPAGAEVAVMVWHPAALFIHGREGKRTTFAQGKNTADFSVKAPADR